MPIIPVQLCRSAKSSATTVRSVTPNHLISAQIKPKSHPNYSYADNRIRTTKYTFVTFVPKNLFEQFHRFANIYFLFIQVLNWIPGITAFAKEVQILPLIFVLGVTAVKDLYEDRRRHRSDKRVNNSVCRLYDRKSDRFVKTKWQDIRVGDIVHLSCDESVPSDILILRTSDDSGVCYVETANLDGENNLKQRQVVKGYAPRRLKPKEFTGIVECDPPNHQIYRFNGYIKERNGEKIAINKDNLLLRDCVLKNTDFIDGIVVYAGHETKAMLNNGGPRYKRSKLERVMNRDVIWCVVILLLMCITGSIGYGFWLSSFDNVGEVVYLEDPTDSGTRYSPAWNGFLIFWTFIILYQVIIPLSLYVTIELIKLGQIYHIHEDRQLKDETTDKKVFCRALNITEDLGQIEYIFSDKTGTLTENRMVFSRCSIGAIDYNHEKPKQKSESTVESDEDIEEFLLNPHLKEELSLMAEGMPSGDDTNGSLYELSAQNQRIQDFFVLLAVCNSAVATRHPHRDEMTASGQYLNKESPNASPAPNTGRSPSFKKPISALLSVLPNLLSSQKPSQSRSPSPSLPFKPIYESESPDEVALVTAAFRYGIKLLKRNADMVVVSLPGEGVIKFQVLNILPFDSTRKKMSIILRHPKSNQIILYCKGADSAILDSLSKDRDQEMKTIIEITEKQLSSYSRKGLRTLCMSKRLLSEEEYYLWNEGHKRAEQSLESNERMLLESHNRIERNLVLMGATGIEDSLQERVPEVIASLRSAGIIVWVLTGDKQETAVNIAYSCRLFTNNMKLIYLNFNPREDVKGVMKSHLKELEAQDMAKEDQKPDFPKWMTCLLNVLLFGTKLKIKTQIDTRDRSQRGLVIDGKSLSIILEKDYMNYFLEMAQYCSSVLCCRATPLQKASVVRNVKEKLNVMTLAIGDGANDVSMIQTADVGIGISGQEGTQAVMASDFTLPRFLYLERLLLVHGNWSYYRLSRVILYFFYKNASSVFVIFWFQMFCGWSGAVMIDQLYLMIVNALFTAFPPMILGIYDRDCPPEVLMRRPHLYSRGRKSRMYTEYSFWVNMFDAAYQSVIMFFIPYLFYVDSDIGIYEFGTIVFTACILVHLAHLAMEFRSWSLLHLMAMSFSIFSYFSFAYIYNYLTLGGLFTSGAYMVIQHISTDFKFWFSLLCVVVLAPLPRCVIRVLQTSLTPSPITKAVKTMKELNTNEENDIFLNNIPSKRRTMSAVWTKKTSPVIMAKMSSKTDNRAKQ